MPSGDWMEHRGHHVVDCAWTDIIDGVLAQRRDWFVLEHHTGECPHPSEPHASPLGARAEIDRCQMPVPPQASRYITLTDEEQEAVSRLEMERVAVSEYDREEEMK